ncbi:MAG: histidinol phosphate phosphatase [Rhodospirillales bacterium]|nr:histidinol phosphate phosphatase [Rhodospirillales bacterium]MBO6787902.1 histidinol phosphate phosphatase [Rhodospirillales bacterium]
MTGAADTPADIDDILDLAGRLADAARPGILANYRSGIGHIAKGDESPVTEADRAAERAMRDIIEAERPGDGIFGEEFGVTNPDADTVWILDPIDGTKAFITGKPVFGILIGVVRNGRAIAGVTDGPATGDRWIGGAGRETLFNGKSVTTRKGVSIENAWLTATSPEMFVGSNKARFEALMGASRYTTFGSECQGYGQLACGWVDLVCEDTLAPYDYAALIPIIEGAGGVISDWSGNPLTFAAGEDDKKHSVIAAADAALHKAAVAILSA